MPIGHVVMFTFTPETTPEVVSSLFDSLEAVSAQCEGIESYCQGSDLRLRDGNADYAISAIFRDENALAAYTADPTHRLVNTEYKRFISHKSSVQFAIPVPTKR